MFFQIGKSDLLFLVVLVQLLSVDELDFLVRGVLVQFHGFLLSSHFAPPTVLFVVEAGLFLLFRATFLMVEHIWGLFFWPLFFLCLFRLFELLLIRLYFDMTQLVLIVIGGDELHWHYLTRLSSSIGRLLFAMLRT